MRRPARKSVRLAPPLPGPWGASQQHVSGAGRHLCVEGTRAIDLVALDELHCHAGVIHQRRDPPPGPLATEPELDPFHPFGHVDAEPVLVNSDRSTLVT